MPSYRKIPVVIEAWPVKELIRCSMRDWKALPKQIEDAYDRGELFFFNDREDRRPYVRIRVLGGDADFVDALYDDYVICGVKGELYPCKPDIFVETYAELEHTDPARDLIFDGIEAFRLTREYLGNDALPEVEGWSWYDWVRKAEDFLYG